MFTKVINRRLAKYVEQVEIFPETQNGGRTGRGTSDSTFSIKQICEYRREKNIPTYSKYTYQDKKALRYELKNKHCIT